jgi:hypothetical protein
MPLATRMKISSPFQPSPRQTFLRSVEDQEDPNMTGISLEFRKLVFKVDQSQRLLGRSLVAEQF